MDKNGASILAFILMGFVLLFFARGFMAAMRVAMSGGVKLHLNAPEGEPPLHIEALLLVIKPFTFPSKRAEFQNFLEDLARRPGCAGTYGLLMDEIEKAMDEYRSLPASHDQADVVLGALHGRQRVEEALKKHFDEQLKPFGVRIVGVAKLAIGTRPPMAPPPNAPPVPV